MNVNFAPMDDNYIKAKVKTGYYSNAAEVVRDAVRRMREQEDRFLAALEIDELDIASGRKIPYSKDLLSQMEQRARMHVANEHPSKLG